MQTDGRTHVKKLIVVFRNFANRPIRAFKDVIKGNRELHESEIAQVLF